MEEYLKLDVACELNSFRRSIEKQHYSIKNINESPQKFNEHSKMKAYNAKKLSSNSLPLSRECKTLERKIEKDALKKQVNRRLNNKIGTQTISSNESLSPIFKSVNSYYNIDEDAII